jgi:catechol 2,3-dioxygenase-like lactoylglutathione lyase family enzyme
MSQRFGWGHININVKDLDASVLFYQKLGFEPFISGIPYLNLTSEHHNTFSADAAAALGVPPGTRGRACIMQLDSGFPKIDLTELAEVEQREPLQNTDRGLVRLCLISQDLMSDYDHLKGQRVEFLSPPKPCHQRMADVATCVDPDGSLIELLQVYLDKWPPMTSPGPSNGSKI